MLSALNLAAQSLQPGGKLRPEHRRLQMSGLEETTLLQRVGIYAAALRGSVVHYLLLLN